LFLLAAVVLFQVTTVEWRSLMRDDNVDEQDRFAAIRGGDASESTAIRVAVWNVNSQRSRKSEILATLVEFAPDLCLLQETGIGGPLILPEDLVGGLAGFHWVDTGDCGVLSRFPVSLVGDGAAGQTGTRQFAAVQLPRGSLLLVANVHLMKSLVFRPPFSGDRLTYRAGHDRRISQYPDLMRQIEQHSVALETGTVILAGDFNLGADMHSLDPIRQRLRDVWIAHGLGWGATALSRFPVARIDHCWVSDDIQCVAARVISTQVSDHRPLVVDLIIPNTASPEGPATGAVGSLARP
jgi:endonuclease/exonuclease/phosphatase (EEP) superfamily protein YafD